MLIKNKYQRSSFLSGFASLLFFFFAIISLSAQEKNSLEALITDRPDQTESPNVMLKGFLQVETGLAYESFKENNIKTEATTFNTSLLRYGLLDNLELRLGWDYTEGKINTINNVTNGFSPLLIGVKVSIAKETEKSPEIGLLVHTSHPFFAAEDYKTKSTGVDFRFAFAHTLSEKSSLSYNLGMAWNGESTSANYLYTLAYGYSVSEKIGAYVELYGNLEEGAQSDYLWDAGLTYLISNNVQLDATVGTSITKGQDLLISGGISFRLPKK